MSAIIEQVKITLLMSKANECVVYGGQALEQ